MADVVEEEVAVVAAEAVIDSLETTVNCNLFQAQATFQHCKTKKAPIKVVTRGSTQQSAAQKVVVAPTLRQHPVRSLPGLIR